MSTNECLNNCTNLSYIDSSNELICTNETQNCSAILSYLEYIIYNT